MKDNKQELKFSVVDVEKKYTVDPTDTVYGGGNGIVSWGADNSLPSLMRTCYEKSTTLGAAIDQSVVFVCGDGVNVSDYAAKWKEEVNRRHMTIEELVNHIAYDIITYGNCAIQIIYNKLGLPCELYPLDVTKCRVGDGGKKVLYSKKSWSKYQTKGEEYDRFGYCDFNPEKPTQILFYNGTGVKTTYNKAPWFSSLTDVLCEIEAGNYSLNSISNGFSAKYVFNFPQTSNLTDEQKESINTSIKDKFCGPDASNLYLLYWTDGNSGLDVKKIEADETPERFIAIKDNCKANIYASLRMSPLLCGMSLSNTGFSTQEFSDSFKLYDRTVAEGFRKTIEMILDDLTGIKDSAKLIPFTITFENKEEA